MKTKYRIGAALLALALCILPVAAFHVRLPAVTLMTAVLALGGLAFGTVTFTYEDARIFGSYAGNFAGGSAVAPTAAQSQQINALSASVSFTDTDTTFTFTHNWGLSAAQAAALFPEISWNIIGSLQAVGTGVCPVLSFNVTSSTNVITVTKLQATGSGNTISMIVRRPATPGT